MYGKEFQYQQEQFLLEIERSNRNARIRAFEEEENQRKALINDLPKTGINQASDYTNDQSPVDDLALEFRKLRELTPEELEIKTEFDEYVKLVEKYVYLDYTSREQLKFERKIKKFERKMENGLTRYGEILKMGTWGSEDYLRLRDKFFPNYIDVINDEIDRIKIEVNITVSQLTSLLIESILSAEAAIKLAGDDQTAAENLMIDSAAKMQETIQKRVKASETLKEYGTDENSVPILAEFDKIIARYEALNKLFTDIILGIGEDFVEFQKILPELDRNERLLNDFNVKLAGAKKLSEFQDLKNIEIPILITEIDTLYNKALSLNRTTGAVDEIAYKKEKDQMDQTILEQEGKVDQIKADEIERRRLAEIERKRKEEERKKKELLKQQEADRLKKEQKDKAKKTDSYEKVPSIFIKKDSHSTVLPKTNKQSSESILEGRGGKDYTKNRWDPSTAFEDSKMKIDESKFSKSEKEFFAQYKKTCDSYLKEWYSGKNVTEKLTGDMFVNAAKRVFIKYKHLSYVVPAELALIQGRLESGLGTKGASNYTNPMNVGETDKGAKPWVKKMTSPEEGIFFYMDLMAHDYLSAKTADQLLEKQGKTFVNEKNSRYASAPRYEMELKAMMGQVGLVRDNKRPTVGVGKSYEKNDNSKSAIFVREMLQQLGYKESILGDAIEAFQKKEMYPPLTDAQKKGVSNMNSGDKKSFDIKESKGIDGSASPKANTVGLLYYMTHMGNTVASFSTAKSDQITTLGSSKNKIDDFYKQYKKEYIDMIALGKNLLPYCKYYATEVIDIIDKLGWSEQDNLAYILANKATEIELKHLDPTLLQKMQDLLDPANNWSSIAEKKVQWERVKTALGEEKVEKADSGDKAKTKNTKSKPIAVDFKITESVGAKGDNIVEDVKIIQDLLINFNYLKENDDEVTLVSQTIKSKSGPKLKDSQLTNTIAAIKQFQKYGATTGKTLYNQDGRVDKSGGTITSMRELNRVYVNYKDQKFEEDISNVLKESQWVSQFRYGYNFKDGEDKLDEEYANFVKKQTGLADPADLLNANKAQINAVEKEYLGKGIWFNQKELTKHGIRMSQKARSYKPNYVCCWDAAKTMLGFTGASEKGVNYKIQTFVADLVKGKVKNGEYTNQMPIGIKYIDGQLKAGKAVFIGVERGGAKKQNEYITDHYILIVGKHKDKENKYYYNYFDPGKGGKKDGCDITQNRLLIADDKSGVENKKYKISQIRTNNE